jgi:hypothetical protein
LRTTGQSKPGKAKIPANTVNSMFTKNRDGRELMKSLGEHQRHVS